MVITLEGELGSGKTTLARALCTGLGVFVLGAVTSPTFSVIQHYDAPKGPVMHVDLYRLKSVAELDDLGWDEMVASAAVLLVEWPARAMHTLPRDAIGIVLSHDGENPERRLLKVNANGAVRA